MSLAVVFWTMTAFAFALGAVVGSFLNVVIHRVPAGMSVVHPPSHCPRCDARIAWHDNIPIFSWAVLLRGRCRQCAAPIPARYTVVEALTGLLTAALFARLAAPHFDTLQTFATTSWSTIALPFALYCAFIWLLIAITFVDLEHLIIPHVFTVPGMILGLAAPWIFDLAFEAGELRHVWPPVTWLESSVGFLVGGLSVLAIFYAYYAVRGVAGIGGGDVTLMALVGAWLGWPAVIFVFFAASLQGTIAAAAAMLLGGGLLHDSAEIYADDEPTDDAHPRAPSLDAAPQADPRAPVEDASTHDTPPSPTLEADAAALIPTEAEASPDALHDPEEATPPGQLAVPFGPFIALAAVEHLLLGDLLPAAVSMSYLYQFGSW